VLEIRSQRLGFSPSPSLCLPEEDRESGQWARELSESVIVIRAYAG
jgi:hypothetical protein